MYMVTFVSSFRYTRTHIFLGQIACCKKHYNSWSLSIAANVIWIYSWYILLNCWFYYKQVYIKNGKLIMVIYYNVRIRPITQFGILLYYIYIYLMNPSLQLALLCGLCLVCVWSVFGWPWSRTGDSINNQV